MVGEPAAPAWAGAWCILARSMPPAARLADQHVCPMFDGPKPHVGGPITGPGCATVLIGGMPAARVTDMATCVGPPDLIVKGSPTVMIGFMMAARMGDNTAHGGVIVTGFPTVMIGEAGSAGGGGGGAGAAAAAFADAAESGTPLIGKGGCEACGGACHQPRPTPAEVQMAKEPGTSPEKRAAREKVARDFYSDHPSLGEDRFEQDVKGIDLDEPVEVVSFPPPPTMKQHVREGGKPGVFFDPVGDQEPESLGINGGGRVAKEFSTPPGEGLKSTAAPIVDDWTDPANPLETPGGGTQIVVDKETRDRFVEV